MVQTNLLRRELHGSTPDLSELEILEQAFMDLDTEVSNRAVLSRQDDRRIVIWNLTLWLGVDSDEILIVPNGLQQFVEVPSEHTSDGHVVRNLVEHFELFHADHVDLVEHVDARHVLSVALDSVDQVVFCGVAVQVDVRVEKSVLLRDGSDLAV